jgi:predicted nucleic acid-binding protein
LTDRVVGSVLFEVVCDRSVATYAELADVTQNLLGVGLRLADGLARSAVRLLVEHGVVHTAGDRVSVIVAAAQALETSSTATLTRERERFFQSAIRRLPSGSQLVAGPEGQKPIDAILLSVSSDLGESMAQWVSLGVGSPVSLAGLNSRIREEISNDEEARQAEALLRLILSDPTDDEIPYLYRLLGATFLANTVRLDPIAAAQLNQSMGAYELYLDANVVLPLLVEEHPHHATTRSVVQESIGLGVQLAVLTPILNEVLSHREQARREFAAFRGNAAHLRELAEALGLRTNVFVQGWLGAVPSGTVGTVVEWRDYMAKYSDDSLVARLEECGVAVVEPDADTDSGPLYADALTEIRNAWLLRQGRDRDDILNVHEAVQVCHIHLRRGNSPENRDHIWFLSNETVLQKVFERRPAKWGLPPTFPYSAWAAFLDTRLPFVSKDPRSIVVAITRTQTEAFGLPNPAALVRRRAFGDRVTSRAEEEALEYALSDHNLMLRVETAQRDVVRRGREPGAAKDLAEAQNAAVAEISNALDAQMTRLNDALGRREQDLQAARARIKELETARDHPPRQGEPQRRRRRHSGGKGPTR